MVKTKTIETTEKFDKDGRLIERIVREETSDDDTKYYPNYACLYASPLYDTEPLCQMSSSNSDMSKSEKDLNSKGISIKNLQE